MRHSMRLYGPPCVANVLRLCHFRLGILRLYSMFMEVVMSNAITVELGRTAMGLAKFDWLCGENLRDDEVLSNLQDSYGASYCEAWAALCDYRITMLRLQGVVR